MTEDVGRYDVVVVGAGNAAICAAMAARELGATVLVFERAPKEERGGNTAFTGGGLRFTYRDVNDLRDILPNLTPTEIDQTDFGTYSESQFFDDMARVTEYRADPDLVEALVKDSHDVVRWMGEKGVPLAPMYGRQSYQVDDKRVFWGGLTVEVSGGGLGLVESEHRIAEAMGIEIRYGAFVKDLVTDDAGIVGVRVHIDKHDYEVAAPTVVLASGGFQANTEWRTRYLGPGWDLAKVRGTRFNTGEGHRMALGLGARSTGQWSGCHAVSWDRNAPDYGDLSVADGFQKHSYPLGIMVNNAGRRFLDEGADFRNYTYAKYGRKVLEQPNQTAWQVFDQKVEPMLRDEYRIRQITKVEGSTLRELALRMEGVDADSFVEEVESFNAAVQTDIPFNPSVKDGRGTTGLKVAKTNWANAIDQPPYVAFGVTCGITFTFGGIQITPNAEVVSVDGGTVQGLYAAGEIVGGLFFHNYAGGTGLVAGSVFGRRAGFAAARESLARK